MRIINTKAVVAHGSLGYLKVILIFICVLAFATAVTAPCLAAKKKRKTKKKEPIAMIQVAKGAALSKSKHGTLTKITIKDLPLPLFSGDTLVTHDGRIEIHYADGKSILRVLENSKVRIWDQKPRGGVVSREVLTQFGHMWVRINRDKKIKNSFVTPTAMTSLKETEFVLQVDRDSGASRFSVNQGRLAVNADNKTVLLTSGQFSEVRPGKPPSNPKIFKPKPAPQVPKPGEEPKKTKKRWWQYLWPFD